MKTKTPQVIKRKDYTPPPFSISAVELSFELHPTATMVHSTLHVQRNGDHSRPLVLQGEDLMLLGVSMNNEPLESKQYEVDNESLTIHDVPDFFSVQIETSVNPEANTSLNGLYLSNGMFCTQCEAEGFRKITYFLDRPDVMATYTVNIIAEGDKYPVLLSNGNPVESGLMDNGKLYVRWEDPHPKPSYLFALVAGDLVHREDTFVTKSGREVLLRVYVEPQDLDKTGHAMDSLKKAIKWDEEVFGLEYDLDIYMIVAVSHFNMGAMENKGLNIFNTKYVLANSATATDGDYAGIESVIAHEYFHNWTGNRVTCRDWFQLSLKEGLTVFRDQQFSADQGSPGAQRISDVRALRLAQFPEDAGPQAHPVRPDSYMEINNFYTATVYEKGAEVVRMLHTLHGQEGFRKGMDLYFERHDGQAVTCDDFVTAMADANDTDLSQFMRWYEQAGTPVIRVDMDYDEADKTCTLSVRQQTPPTPGQKNKKPLHIPLAVGLLDGKGKEIPLRLKGENKDATATNRVLDLKEAKQSFTFVDVPEEPVPSLLRGYSAPVKLEAPFLTKAHKRFLMANDTDDFNRWEAAQSIACELILAMVEQRRNGKSMTVDPDFIDAFRSVLTDDSLDPVFRADALSLPGEGYLSQLMEEVDVDGLFEARERLQAALAEDCRRELAAVYEAMAVPGAYRYTPEDAGRRRLRNVCLAFLSALKDRQAVDLCYAQFADSEDMTTALGALSALTHLDVPERDKALNGFYEQWREESLVVDKWFALQAVSRLPGTIEKVKALTGHEAFDLRNPNKIRALVGAFVSGNPVRFHDASGAGYAFLGDKVLELNPINPQMAARLVGGFNTWRRYDKKRQGLMRRQLERIVGHENVSKDVYEIASKALEN